MANQLQHACDAVAFLRQPIGRYVADATSVVACPSPTLCIAVSWGCPAERDIRAYVRLLDVAAEVGPELDMLVDLAGIVRIDADAILVFRELLRQRLPGWRVRRQAVILPEGLTGILLAGVHATSEPRHAVRFVTEQARAWDFLDRPDVPAAHTAVQLVAARFRGGTAAIDQLRAELERDPVKASVTRAAAAIGLSPRSLQRHLARIGSSFSHELRRVRVAAASELLVLTDAKVEDVARRVGFASASRMGAAFRRDLGLTPNAIRHRETKRTIPSMISALPSTRV